MFQKTRISPLQGLILLHPLVITFILLSSSYPVTYTIPGTYWFIIFTSLILSSFFWFLQRWLKPELLTYILLLTDIPLITVITYFTGGAESLFPLLYILLIIISAIFLYRRGAYVVSLISVVFFLILMFIEINNKALEVKYVMQQFYIFSLLFLLTGILSGSLSERYRIKTEELKKLNLTMEEIVKNIPSGILVIDNAGTIIYTNIFDENIKSFVHLHLARYLKNPERHGSVKELKIQKKFYLLSCSLISNDHGALAILQDLTEIKKLEETSRISKQTKMLAELGGSLAHEIRNPLASIRGSLEVIAKSRVSKSAKPFIDMALKESIRLNEIVSDFLSFAQFVPKKTYRTTINDVLNESLLEVMPGFAGKKLEIIRTGNNFEINADLNRLKSGVSNIIVNACEVSEPGKRIIITTDHDDKFGWIEITDEGPGIPKKDLKKIFKPFYTTKKGGTGLGLSIAQKIIEAHNGKIEVSSKVGKGTTFKIILPRA
ncbi:MAG: ATP-binding protein [candidate division WOR-3 bacterium]|nr:ATP-binding protein [candidate division WOR-3 bacterium]